jgi:hypothetical protein
MDQTKPGNKKPEKEGKLNTTSLQVTQPAAKTIKTSFLKTRLPQAKK